MGRGPSAVATCSQPGSAPTLGPRRGLAPEGSWDSSRSGHWPRLPGQFHPHLSRCHSGSCLRLPRALSPPHTGCGQRDTAGEMPGGIERKSPSLSEPAGQEPHSRKPGRCRVPAKRPAAPPGAAAWGRGAPAALAPSFRAAHSSQDLRTPYSPVRPPFASCMSRCISDQCDRAAHLGGTLREAWGWAHPGGQGPAAPPRPALPWPPPPRRQAQAL